MGLLDLFNPEPTETEKEIQRHQDHRKYERDVFDSALRHWLLQSGLGPVFFEQTQEFAAQAGFDEWPVEQLEHYNSMDFDPRLEGHAEILEFVVERSITDSNG